MLREFRTSRPSRRVTRAILAGVVAGLLFAGSAVDAEAQGAAGLVPGGDPPDLLLLHTGDVIGYIEPCG